VESSDVYAERNHLVFGQFDLLKQGQAYLAPPKGNYKQPLKNHVAQNGETGGDPGKTRYALGQPQEVDGKLIIQPTLDWWVREQKFLHTDIVKRELEHVSRWLYWQEKGGGSEMISDFNRHPAGKKALGDQAETARFHESLYQETDPNGIHAKGRHDLGVRPAKDMDPAVLERLIQNVGPVAFPHHLNDAGLQ
jgi:hypothetical protein